MEKIKLVQEQHAILRSKAKRLYVCGGRQGGKTFAIEMLMAMTCVATPSTLVLYTAKADQQVVHVWREMQNHPWIAKHIKQANRNEKILFFNNGSYIKFSSTREPDGIKGVPYSLVVLDEVMDAWTEGEYNQVVPALVAARRGRIIYSGQPRTLRHWFARLYLAGIPKGTIDPYSGAEGLGLEDHQTIVFPTPKGAMFQDADGKKELKLLEASVDALTWERDYLCKWLDISEKNAFDPDDIKQCIFDAPRKIPMKRRAYCVGHDLGFSKDWGVSKVVDIATGEVVASFRAPKGMKHRRPSDETDQVREVYKLARTWNNATVYVDGTGGGDPGTQNDYAREYTSIIPDCHALFFLNNTKESMVDRLKFALERKLVQIPRWDERLIDELLAYECEIKGDRRVFHGGAGMHDDEVCALILAHEGAIKMRRMLGGQDFTLSKHITGG